MLAAQKSLNSALCGFMTLCVVCWWWGSLLAEGLGKKGRWNEGLEEWRRMACVMGRLGIFPCCFFFLISDATLHTAWVDGGKPCICVLWRVSSWDLRGQLQYQQSKKATASPVIGKPYHEHLTGTGMDRRADAVVLYKMCGQDGWGCVLSCFNASHAFTESQELLFTVVGENLGKIPKC